MKKFRRVTALLLGASLLTAAALSGCGNASTPSEDNTPSASVEQSADSQNDLESTESTSTPQSGGTLAVYSAYQEDEGQYLFDAFKEETGITVKSVRLSAGEMYARVQAEASNPQVALLMGVPTDTLDVAGVDGLLESYKSEALSEVPESLQDANEYWSPHTLSIMCIISNTDMLAEMGETAPTKWDDLLKPAFKDNVVMPHPATSGTGYVYLAARLFDLGEDEGFAWMKQLDENIFQYCKGGAAPARMVGLGESATGICLSADALNTQATGQPVTITFPEDGVSINVTGMSLVKNAPADQVENAKLFIDWLLSVEAQEAYASEYMRMPVNSSAELPDGMAPYSELNTVVIDATWSTENRDTIIDRFENDIRNQDNVLE